MSETPQERLQRAIDGGRKIREVKSFVLREGRLTKGQELALAEFWPSMGIDYQPTLLDFDTTFTNKGPVVLEIGFGMGASLVEMAKNEHEKNFIGIEVHKPGVGACLKLAAEESVSNLKLFEHDAVEVLKHMIADNSLSRVQLFFPDPWHKKRHHKRRIVQPEFIELLRQKLAVGGVFHMATDWENYAEHMLDMMNAAEGYKNQSEQGNYVPRPERRPLTKFEQRGQNLGHGVWDLMFEKL
ncbi:tRNA (guanosine(46)-N7)-methyltransferase TrmB [Algibacillus agarilyticus]|uniref:tRNA (guanosine(46)-N7)-methyltransferase TrmB n=1 Tax=Algibacillus agarilyticus TaxID=2234133 RepID=UPI000DCFA68B|nr:tRNA (guanosine(46)-N7)-methyltransferase TrmB [Algibacillus agarilyticus]